MSKWEIENCPWWIDFQEGHFPQCELELYKAHEKLELECPSMMGRTSEIKDSQP
eukprot:c45345_g1_i1 orf=3-161(-)